MNVLVVVNAYTQYAAQIGQAKRIEQELKKLGASVCVRRNFSLAELKNGEIFAEKYDFCVYLDKDKVCARLLEKRGIRLYNRASAVESCDDKMLTSIALSSRGINLPDSVYAPLCYTAGASPNLEFLRSVGCSLGFPLVAKANYGSLGAGVQLIRNFEELENYEAENIFKPHFYQRFIDCGGGEDVRVLVVGGKFLCAMKRSNPHDFRSNIGLGGTGSRFAADKELIALCERVAAILELDYCGVDVLFGKDGKRYICEVNSNAFFEEAEEVCGVNVARSYAEYMLKKA